MNALRPLLALTAGLCLAQLTNAQDAPATRLTDPYQPNHSSRYQYRSRTSPHQPSHSRDGEYGFRNPGGVGRYEEFYPPGNTFESGGTGPTRVARFDNGNDSTSRSMQLQSQSIGNARTQTLNQQIDSLARPIGLGYGYGFGGFGLFPY